MFRGAVRSPLIIAAIAAFAAIAGAITLWAAASTPWLGTGLIPLDNYIVTERGALDTADGAVLVSIGVPGETPVAVTALDLLAEPDSLSRYADIAALYERQDRLAELLKAPTLELMLRGSDGSAIAREVSPEARPLWTLPVSFWIQFATGLISVLISGWVWATRPGQMAPTFFAISGLGVAMVTLSSAYYAHRGLALPADSYALLMPINHAGIMLFGGGMIALFLTYPRRLVGERWLWVVPAVLVPFYLMDTFRIGIEADIYYVFVLCMTLSILGLIVVQWWVTRNSPDDRAVLGWLGLSVAFSICIFAFLSLAPGLLGLNSPLAQHYAAGAIVLIYAGLALGLRRYRLFELGDWSYRILYYTVGAFLLLALDAALIAFLNLDLAPALAVSLLLVGLLYLPLRDWLWQKIFARDQLKQHELFSSAMQVAFAPSRTDSAQRWRQLLQRVFDPLETLENPNALTVPAIAEDGLVLELPPVAGAPGLRLRYPFGGTGLFQQGHLSLADNLVSLTERAEESRQAYMRGVGEERRRMARDLHDDVGARLLTGLHTADERTRPILQAALSDIRAIVSGLAGDEAELDRVLAELRHEAARRLEAAGIEFDCPLPEDNLPAIKLDYRVHKALTSAVREIVSNVIRHSEASLLKVAVDLDDHLLTLNFEDDGKGLPAAARDGEAQGFGLKNLFQRIEDLGGTVTLASDTGTTIVLRVPLLLNIRPPEPGVQPLMAALESQP
jgi:two-component system sensor histidine kinase DevS